MRIVSLFFSWLFLKKIKIKISRLFPCFVIRPHGQKWLTARGNRKSCDTSLPMIPTMCFQAHRRITYGQLTLPGAMCRLSATLRITMVTIGWQMAASMWQGGGFPFFFLTNTITWGPREGLGREQIFKMRKLAGFCIGAGRIKLVVTIFQNMCAARKEFNYLMAKDCESQFRTIFTIFYVCFCINFN